MEIPTTMHTGVPESKTYEHDKQVCDDSTDGNTFGRARSVLSWTWNRSCDTFPCCDILSISGENKGLCHVIPGSRLRVEHTASQSHMIQRFAGRAKTVQSCACEPPDLQSSFQQIPRHVARVFPACLGACAEESGSRPPDNCSCCTSWYFGTLSTDLVCARTSYRVLILCTRSMLAPLWRVWYMVMPLSHRASVAVLNIVATVG